MTDSNRVSIVVNGKIYAGWKSVRIESSIDQVARAFALSVTDQFPGNQGFSRLRPGDAVRLYIGDDLVCTGYITAVPVRYDAKSVTVNVQGKSRTVDLVNCCPMVDYGAQEPQATASGDWSDVRGNGGGKAEIKAPASQSGTWNNVKTSEIIAALAAPYGVRVYTDGTQGSKLANFTVTPGETVIEAINRLITKDNLIVTDNEEGNLVIREFQKVGNTDGALVLGENILSGGGGFDFSDRFSHYIVLGQHTGTDDDFGRTAAEDQGIASDPEISRFRLKVLKNEGQSTIEACRQRAEFEVQYRSGATRKLEYAVQGWRKSSGGLWKAGEIVTVKDEVLQIRGDFLLTKVTFTLSSSGMTTKMSVCPPEGYKAPESNMSKQEDKTETSWKDVS